MRGWVDIHTNSDEPDNSPELLTALNAVPGVMAYERTVRIPFTAEPAVRWYLEELTPQVLLTRWQPSVSTPLSVPDVWAAKLYPHQVEGCEFLLRHGGGLLCDEMGLGKSRTAAIAARCALPTDKPILIIGPKFTRAVWRAELKALGFLRDDEKNFIEIEGRDVSLERISEVRSRLYDMRNTAARFVFIHFDVLPAWQGIIYSWGFGAVILDEAHYAREGRNQRSKAVSAVMGCAPFRIALTGTPLVNKPSELWHLLTLVNGPKTWGHPVAFRQRYCGAQREEYGLVDGEPSHVGELTARLAGTYLRRTALDVGANMVPFTRQSLEADLGVQEEAYRKAEGTLNLALLTRALLSGQMSKDVLIQLGKLRKLTSKAKMPTTVSYVTDLLTAGESVVVFCHERATAQALAQKVTAHHETRARKEFGDERSPAVTAMAVTGEMPEAERSAAVAAFQRNAPTQPILLAATYGSLGVGVTLTAARFVVMHDLEWTFAAMLQGEKRVHRLSSARGAVQSTWVLAEQSVDQIIARILLKKAEYLGATLGQHEASEAAADLNLTELSGADNFVEDMLAWAREWGQT